LLARPAATVAGPTDKAGLIGAFLSIWLLTLANPATILSFFAVFAGLGLDAGGSGATAATPLVAGVFLGSAAWWLLLSFLAGLLRRHLNDGRARVINVLAGLSLLGLAAWSLWPVVVRALSGGAP
jgi:threonine/homoserine/homoserine lactone efflux protein